MDYEKEQQRLLKLMEEVMEVTQFDDEAEKTEDNLEIREEDSESEQELESDGEMDVVNEGPFMFGKDGVTKWKNHISQKSNARTRSINLVKHLPGAKSKFQRTA
ncbi:hypothetical protein QE152_g33233 [Popillia japonica]|uniref:Uncharacterized protein n=1 Tax=Popillia japonica TaxID=7064 RepID=A0AAW1IY16_POPJA